MRDRPAAREVAGESPAGSDASGEDPNRALERFDRAAESVLREDAFSAVRLGPWWNLPVRGSTPGTGGWKRAALERRPGAGARHWGHLFLVWAPGGRGVGLRPDDLGPPRPGGDGRAAAVVRFRLEEGALDLWLLARASMPETRDRLEALARRLASVYEAPPRPE